MNVARALNIFFCSTLLLLSITGHAQRPVGDTASKTQITILRSKVLNLLKKDSFDLTILAGDAAVKQDSTIFSADSIVLNRTLNVLEAYRHVHINDRDSIHTYSDYLKYLSKDKKAHLEGNVKLTDGKGVLTTSSLDYDVNTKTGIYNTGGKVLTDKSVLTSKEAFYYGETKDVYFKKNVVMNDTDYTIHTDTLLYNTYTDVATFIVPTVITHGVNTKILTSDGYYDKKSKKAYFGKRPDIRDGTTFLRADEVAYDSTGFGEARGKVIFKDTGQGAILFCDNLKTNRNEKSFLATVKPVMMLKQQADSMYIAADTMYSGKLSDLQKFRFVPQVVDSLPPRDSVKFEEDSANRFIEAYYHVRIFSDSLQALGDSLFYTSVDSVFRLFKKPVMWSRESQVTGDTIYLFSKDKKPKRMYAFENGLTISKVTDQYFNEVKGRTINAYFVNGNIDYVRAKGNAENVYYATDESNKYIGVNNGKSDIIDVYFDTAHKPQRVVMRSSPEGVMSPMRQVNHEQIRLRGFKWLDDIRPKTKEEILQGYKLSDAIFHMDDKPVEDTMPSSPPPPAKPKPKKPVKKPVAPLSPAKPQIIRSVKNKPLTAEKP